ncbi:MAG: histidinol phosphate phosphatase domain-containing protein [Desulfatiglans sp.]|jgi:histidinol phosphatase-like PHP family hydrolase|nr:histidinol phosphate phosphatase domain-containing protein [Thermodesulfobacteriota bacterium]MEE4351835.1 histidinol phosphate phosphatase domain-containing protein [Desulfatiglans sp.]
MIDLHTHSLFSDGALIPSELVRRLEMMGYIALAMTDHVDFSMVEFVVPRIIKVAEELNRSQPVTVVPGVELTHIPPSQIKPMITMARDLGAALVVVHGETIAEPVAPGTNRAAIEAGADILAHPGLIDPADAALAAQNNVFLEISARAGHSLTNGHVAKTALEKDARLLINSDGHAPGDFMTREFAEKIVEGAGLERGGLDKLLANSRILLQRVGYPL